MQDFFSVTATEHWNDPTGQLHAYLVPSEDFRIWCDPLLRAAATVDFLAPQPREALHATVHRFKPMGSEITQATWDALEEASKTYLADLAPLEVKLSPPTAMHDAVVFFGELEGWDELIAAVRAAAHEVLDDAFHYNPPFGPHMTLAYGVAEGDDALIEQALSEAFADQIIAAPVPEFFTELHWCLVHQDRAKGIYTFDTVMTVPFGRA